MQEKLFEICDNLKKLTGKLHYLQILKKIKRYVMNVLNSINNSLSFTTIKYIQIYYKYLTISKLTYTNTNTSYITPFPRKGNINKCKDAVLNHN